MQEEVVNKTLTLIVSGTKFTGRLLKAAITKYMAHRKEVKVEKRRKLRRENRPSVLERLEQYKDMARNTVEKVRKKVLER